MLKNCHESSQEAHIIILLHLSAIAGGCAVSAGQGVSGKGALCSEAIAEGGGS